jgi:hypothetical protein
MPVYVSVASSHCKAGELARTCWKRTEGVRRKEDVREPTMVGTGKGWKLIEGTRNIWKYLATTMGRRLDMRSLIEKKESAVR